MAFIITCPNCGERSVQDFRYAGEVLSRPSDNDSGQQWTGYFYFKKNESGVQKEWWYHKFGCRKWFFALRNVQSNEVLKTFWPEEAG